jgi:nickel-dependent lactate racemase
MKVSLAYGKTVLDIEVPAHAEVIEPQSVPGVPDEKAALRQALRAPIESPPLADLVKAGDRVVIVHSDLTRPMPNDRVLPALLAELEAAGVQRRDITLLNGLGTHRKQSREELVEMLGSELVERFRCEQHDGWDGQNLVSVGRTRSGRPVEVNRLYLEADVRILTGFIEPHLFAGFSGGPKAVLPSIASIDSVLANHSVQMVGHPNATWGVREGNPIWEEMLEAALMTRPTLLLNVTLNRTREITGVFAGDLEAAHAAGCEFCGAAAFVPVPHFYDVVITTNSGYPLDINLYQAVKGMSAAARAVKPGGAIILAAECRDGIPEHGEYARLLRSAVGPQALLDQIHAPGFLCHDQWEAQVQAMVQMRAEVHVYSDGLSDRQIREAMLIPCDSIRDTVARLVARYGRGARVCVLPDGPQTIPTYKAAGG